MLEIAGAILLAVVGLYVLQFLFVAGLAATERRGR